MTRDRLVPAGVPWQAFAHPAITVAYPGSPQDIESVQRDEPALAASRARDGHKARPSARVKVWLARLVPSLVKAEPARLSREGDGLAPTARSVPDA